MSRPIPKSSTPNWLTLFGPLLVAAMLMGCNSTSQLEKSRSEALDQYGNLVRWGQWDGAVNFVAPDYLKEHPISRLDLDRLRLFHVTNYTIRSTQVFDEGKTVTQLVELRLFHKSQAVERRILDEQLWRYDEEQERWWLHTGLPDPTRRQ